MERYIPRMPREDEPVPPELNLRCTSCGYELTGLIDRRCPECGEAFDPRETWLENERSTWSYHFENICSKWDYARMGYLLVVALFFLVMVLADVKTLLAIPLVVLGEMYIIWTGGPGVQIRMAVWTVCAAWGVLMMVLAW